MEPNIIFSRPFLSALILVLWLPLSCGCSFTIANYCPHPIWPGTLAGAGTPQLSTTGFLLESGQMAQIPAPLGWSGRIWARTGCQFDRSGVGRCQTGDCGGRMECSGSGALPPTTLFEITLGLSGEYDDYYDVSIVDGYNLPIIAIPRAQHGACNSTGCLADLNHGCPRELQVDCGDGVIACKSACEAFGQDEYCCSGPYASPATCRPSLYSSIFKSACPRAYSYAFDDGTSTFTCKAYDYTIIFCPPNSRMKTAGSSLLGPQTTASSSNGPDLTGGHFGGFAGEPWMTASPAVRQYQTVFWFLLLIACFLT